MRLAREARLVQNALLSTCTTLEKLLKFRLCMKKGCRELETFREFLNRKLSSDVRAFIP